MQHLRENAQKLALDRKIATEKYLQKKHRKANIVTGGLVIFLVIGMFAAKQKMLETPQVLGETTISVEDQKTKFCRDNGGKVTYTYNLSDQLEPQCQFEDIKCRIADVLPNGTCKIAFLDAPSITPPTPTPLPNAYYVKVKDDATDPKSISILRYLQDSLDQLNQRNITLNIISYDAQNGNPHNDDRALDFAYYIITPDSLREGDIALNQAQFEISSIDSRFVASIANPKYCRIDSDCQIRESLCAYGAFNTFEPFLDGYVCKKYTNEFGQSTRVFDEKSQCQAELIYLTASCIENSCVPQNSVLRCIEED